MGDLVWFPYRKEKKSWRPPIKLADIIFLPVIKIERMEDAPAPRVLMMRCPTCNASKPTPRSSRDPDTADTMLFPCPKHWHDWKAPPIFLDTKGNKIAITHPIPAPR